MMQPPLKDDFFHNSQPGDWIYPMREHILACALELATALWMIKAKIIQMDILARTSLDCFRKTSFGRRLKEEGPELIMIQYLVGHEESCEQRWYDRRRFEVDMDRHRDQVRRLSRLLHTMDPMILSCIREGKMPHELGMSL